MFHMKKTESLFSCSMAFLAALGFLFAMPELARAHSKKYDKCQAKCVQRAGVCLEDAAEVGDDGKRAKKKSECEHKQKECSEQCED
jgi:hypothetical protein